MQGAGNSVQNYRNFIDQQFNFNNQQNYYGNYNSQQHSQQNQTSGSQQQQDNFSTSPQRVNRHFPINQNNGNGQNHGQSQHNQICKQKSDLQNIKKLFHNKNYEQVLENIEKYLNQYDPRNPNHTGVQCQNNQCSTHQIVSDDRMDLEDRNKDQDNEIIMLLQTKSDCLIHLNRNDDFFRCQDEIFNRDNSQTKVFISKGSIYFQMKRYKESLEDFEKYVSLVKNDDNAFYLKGLVEEKLKLYQDALMSFNQSLTINPNQIKVTQKKTSILAMLFRYEEAIENQKKVIQYFETNQNKQNNKQIYQQYFMMGKLYFHMNLIQDSYAYLEKAIAQRTDHSETYYYLGECFRSMNQLDNALDCYEKAALYDCNNQLAIQRKDELLQKQIQESPIQNQQQSTASSSHIIEEQEYITLDDIKKDMEKLETEKKEQIQQMKEGKLPDSDLFELESTRTLVNQYQLNLASFKSFLRVQDMMERSSIQSNKFMSSIQNFKPRNYQSAMYSNAENSENNSNNNSLERQKMKNRSIFLSTFTFRAPNPPNK